MTAKSSNRAVIRSEPAMQAATGVAVDTSRPTGLVSPVAAAVTFVVAVVFAVAGVVALASPSSYTEVVGVQATDSFVRLSGAFQIGFGTSLLLSLIWREALTVALGGSVVGGVIASVVYAGATGAEGGTLGLVVGTTLLAGAGFVVRYRQLGLVVGDTGPGASDARLAPFERQKTVLLTSYKQDGTAVGTPVSIAVDGERAYARSFSAAFKTKRIRRNPQVELAPCTAKGAPTGPAIRAKARQVGGDEYRRASRLINRKYPLMQGVLVFLGHKMARKKVGRTVHFKLEPERD